MDGEKASIDQIKNWLDMNLDWSIICVKNLYARCNTFS